MGFKKGSKILLSLDDSLLVKKVSFGSFADITKPLRKAKKKIEERQVNSLVHKIRAKNKLF
nr:hypothetical protein [Candidatus Woesearchaeota archaeon]